MKKIMGSTLIMTFFLTAVVFAFPFDVTVLTKDAIKKLTNDQLEEVYIQAKIEVNASSTFYGKAGFTPKEYDKYKDLLRFIINLRQEMAARDMTAPPIDEWIK